MTLRRAIIAAGALTLILANAGIAKAGIFDGGSEESHDNGGVYDTIILTAEERAARRASNNAAPGSDSEPRFRRLDSMLCLIADSPTANRQIREACNNRETELTNDLDCGDDERQLDPLWRQTWDAESGTWSDWAPVNTGACLGAADLADEARRAFKELRLDPSPLHVQPDQGWTLINLHTVTFTDAEPQEFDIELLDIPVTVRAVPGSYSWDYGDGSAPLLTDDTGDQWQEGDPVPDDTWVGHTYTAPGESTITLTTTWSGEFQIRGTTGWTAVDGELTTASSSDPITVHEARTHLVEDPLTD